MALIVHFIRLRISINMTKVGVTKNLKTRCVQQITVLIFLLLSSNIYANQSELNISRVAGSTHFEFSGLSQWDYEVKKSSDPKSITITVPRLKDKSKERILNYSDSVISKIEFLNDNFDSKEQFKITFSESYIDTFDYLTESPSNLVIDFFKNEKKETAEKKQIEIIKSKALAAKNLKKPKREPAASEFFQMVGMEEYSRESVDDLLAEIEKVEANRMIEYNFEYFKAREDAVIDSRGNIYLRFPMFVLEKDHFKTLRASLPDYEILPDDKPENIQARFLLQQFQKKRYASFMQTKKLFLKKFSKSKYKQILGHIEADILLSMWEKNKDPQYLNDALANYMQLVDLYPESPLRERTLLLVALLTKYHVNEFSAIKSIKRFIDEYKDSPFNAQARMLLADSYTKIKSYADALSILEDVKKTAGFEDSVEATYRIGDVYFAQDDFRSAEKFYMDAIEAFPEQASKFPNSYFNAAESQFILNDYKSSLINYGKFTKYFPRHEYGGYAMTRIGELLEIMGYGERVSRGFLNESQIKFPNTVGGKVAKIRLLSRKMKDISKKNELEFALKTMRSFVDEIKLQDIDEFVTFMVSDGFYGRGNYKDSYQELISYFQKKPKPNNREKFEKRIAKSLAAEVKKLVEEKKYTAAINEFEANENTWLKKVGRIDLKFNDGKAYEGVGVYSKALEIYTSVNDNLNAIVKTEEYRERKVTEDLPSFSQVNLRLAAVNRQLNKFEESSAEIKKIVDADLSETEKYEKSLLEIENFISLGKWDESTNKIATLKKQIAEDPKRLVDISILEAKTLRSNSKFIQSAEILENLLASNQLGGKKFEVMKLLFQNYKLLNRSKDAIKWGKQIIEEFPQSKDLAEISYATGDELFKEKNFDEAKTVWKVIPAETMWRKLADNKISEIDWRKEYNSYINRIPAMNKRSNQ